MRFGMTMAVVLMAAAGLGLVGCKKDETKATPATVAAAVGPQVLAKTWDATSVTQAQELINSGTKFLVSQWDKDGGWTLGAKEVQFRPAITALVLKTLLAQADFNKDTPIVQKGFETLLTFRQSDGSIYDKKEGEAAYTTACAVMALQAAKDPRYAEALRQANGYLKGLQIQPGQESPDGKKIEANDPRVGGMGYGKPPSYQPNLGVLGFVMDAWDDSGVSKDDPAVKAAVGFLSRLQNREESNDQPFAKAGSHDGGFVYALSDSKAGPDGDGGVRSYGTMTYVGFKSLLYAGVGKDDPRVQAAFQWIRSHWGLDTNPNMPDKQSKEGLFYYYHVFAKALCAWGEPTIKDAKGVEHNWRAELVAALAQRHQADGSWVNADAARWDEGSKVLSTCYAVIALQEALKK